MKLKISILFLLLSLVACSNLDVSKLSDQDMERISKNLVVCSSPYIRYGTDCCLDKNNNSLCDRDEQSQAPPEQPKSPIVKQEPVANTSDDVPTAQPKINPDSISSPSDRQEVKKANFQAFLSINNEIYIDINADTDYELSIGNKDDFKLSCELEMWHNGAVHSQREFELDMNGLKVFNEHIQPLFKEGERAIGYIVTCSSKERSNSVIILNLKIKYMTVQASTS